MKRLFTLLLAVTMLLSLCACGSSTPKKPIEEMDDDDWEAAVEILEEEYEEEEPVAETEAEMKQYQLGEYAASDDGMVQFSVDSFCFSDYRDSDYLPTDGGYFGAKDGNTFFLFTGTMTYVGDSKEAISYCVYADVDYNNGYVFDDLNYGNVDEFYKDGGLGATIRFEPLTSDTERDIRGYIEVPKVVETDTASPLLLKIRIGRGNYGDVAEYIVPLR